MRMPSRAAFACGTRPRVLRVESPSARPPARASLRYTNMTLGTSPLATRPAWKALEAHRQKIGELHFRKLFAEDATRGVRMTVEAAGIFLDYSKNRVTDETLKLLLQLADDSGLRARIDAMFRGERINITED